VHALLEEYIPFIVLLTALYTVAGGICVNGNLHGTPKLNTAILALGTLLASVMGTTGAAMLLIRPLLRANDNRKHVVHVVIFFIFLVANAGGSLSPLGDPPLFLGFLNGVSFFWTTTHLALPMLFICALLLTLFFVLDTYFYRKGGEERPAALDPTPDDVALSIDGKINFVLLAAVIGLVLMSGIWKPASRSTCGHARRAAEPRARRRADRRGARVARADAALGTRGQCVQLGADRGSREAVRGDLRDDRAGDRDPARRRRRRVRAIVHLVTGADGKPIDVMYFWATGLLSSFLDNAPTYLVFFNLAGGDAQALMTTGATTLAAISAGAVFMGANSYIGNAPNFMVKAIAESRGVRMPSFFAYLGWAFAVLVPVFLLTSWIFFTA
jgi:Na+/H+ antiporter NhaD/arsenite permease-like protein